jgi:Tfp pilus assembly ATPase PilU
MLGSDKSRGYCLEMICADFLADAAMEPPDASTLVHSLLRLIHFLPAEQRQQILERVSETP